MPVSPTLDTPSLLGESLSDDADLFDRLTELSEAPEAKEAASAGDARLQAKRELRRNSESVPSLKATQPTGASLPATKGPPSALAPKAASTPPWRKAKVDTGAGIGAWLDDDQSDEPPRLFGHDVRNTEQACVGILKGVSQQLAGKKEDKRNLDHGSSSGPSSSSRTKRLCRLRPRADAHLLPENNKQHPADISDEKLAVLGRLAREKACVLEWYDFDASSTPTRPEAPPGDLGKPGDSCDYPEDVRKKFESPATNCTYDDNDLSKA